MSKPAPNLNESVIENQLNQDELREYQLLTDKGATLGTETRNPCKKELDMYENCLHYQKENGFINCHNYSEHLKKCNEFWEAVKDYRSKVLEKSDLELPRGIEFDLWEKQMTEWYLKNQLIPPKGL